MSQRDSTHRGPTSRWNYYASMTDDGDSKLLDWIGEDTSRKRTGWT
jgi:hypothetical protein